MSTREQFLDTVLHRMSLEEKVGQCFTFSWRGHLITPSVVDVITKLYAGGLRIEPYTTESATALYYGKKLADENFRPGRNFQPIAKTYFQAKHPGAYVTPERYAQTLNRLQRIATSRPGGVPLHITLDFEGDYSHDYPFGGIQMFPAQMGLTATSDPQLAYETGYVIAGQLTALGVNMLHSPVCDVNVNCNNPEIGVRSFSDKAAVCAEYAVKLYEGLRDGGIIATAKHYPGRGDSAIDAHEDLDIIDVPAETLRSRELLPYRALIEAGIGAIMSAHSSYPAIDSTESPSTLSSKLIVELLRTELGFTGVITTDAMGMGAIVKRWGVPRASVMALKAGCNLILVKNDDDVREQCFYTVLDAVTSGELPEKDLDASVRYVLGMKYDQGLFETNGQVDAASAPARIADTSHEATAKKVADACLTLVKQEPGVLPLTPDKKVLIVEQITPLEFTPNDTYCNSHCLNEAIMEHSMNVINATCTFCATPQEEELLLDIAHDADVVVVTNFYWRIRPGNNTALVRKLIEAGNRVVVLTNTPYYQGCPACARTVLCTFGAMSHSLRAAARFLFGKGDAPGTVPVGNA